jgi:hypothetical protein
MLCKSNPHGQFSFHFRLKLEIFLQVPFLSACGLAAFIHVKYIESYIYVKYICSW